MHPSRYPTDASRVGLVGTLLSGTTLAWFAPLLEKKSPLLNNFENFISEFKASFKDTDSVKTAINKIQRLCQGDRPALTYAAVNCPHRPRRQVNQITTSTNSIKPKSISLRVFDSSNSPSLSNKFEILSQLEEELND